MTLNLQHAIVNHSRPHFLAAGAATAGAATAGAATAGAAGFWSLKASVNFDTNLVKKFPSGAACGGAGCGCGCGGGGGGCGGAGCGCGGGG